MVTRRDLFLRARTAISADNAAFEARELLIAALHITKEDYYLHPSTPVSDQQAAAFFALLERRISGEPLAYLLGEWDFFGYTFAVTPDVLIPRPETEDLVRAALVYLDGNQHVLDLCAGSGCIGITLALERPAIQVVMGELSEPACRVAAANITRLGAPRVTLRREDALLPPDDAHEHFDVIVSNPPYIGLHEPLDNSVRDHEPALALFGGEDGLDFYRAIAAYRLGALAPGGHLLVECGEKQARSVAALFYQGGATHVHTLYDLSGKARVVIAEK